MVCSFNFVSKSDSARELLVTYTSDGLVFQFGLAYFLCFALKSHCHVVVVMILTFKYRLLPSKAQHVALAVLLEDQRQLYNAALEERIGCYQKTGKTLDGYDQCKSLAKWRRDDTEARRTPSNLQRWVISRLDAAYNSFFRRLGAHKGKAGFPRFKGKGQWKSFGFVEFWGIRFDGKRLRWKNFPGGLRVHLHRPMPKNVNIRSCVFKRDQKGWVVSFEIKLETPDKQPVKSAVGIDLGLKVFGYQSDGIIIPNPRIAHKAEKEMRRRQRALARCKRGSKRRIKIKTEVARLHTKIINTRTTWLHQQSARIVWQYDLIVAEDLNISDMMKNSMFARSITDVSWSKFLYMVAYKAEKAGKHFITVDPKNTSQKCSSCEELVPKSLVVRTHECPSCGLTIDRDWNAAINILQAVVGLGADNVTQWSERQLGKLSLVTD